MGGNTRPDGSPKSNRWVGPAAGIQIRTRGFGVGSPGGLGCGRALLGRQEQGPGHTGSRGQRGDGPDLSAGPRQGAWARRRRHDGPEAGAGNTCDGTESLSGHPPHPWAGSSSRPGSRPCCVDGGPLFGCLLRSQHRHRTWKGRGSLSFPASSLCLFPSSLRPSPGHLNTKEHGEFLFPTAAKSLP